MKAFAGLLLLPYTLACGRPDVSLGEANDNNTVSMPAALRTCDPYSEPVDELGEFKPNWKLSTDKGGWDISVTVHVPWLDPANPSNTPQGYRVWIKPDTYTGGCRKYVVEKPVTASVNFFGQEGIAHEGVAQKDFIGKFPRGRYYRVCLVSVRQKTYGDPSCLVLHDPPQVSLEIGGL